MANTARTSLVDRLRQARRRQRRRTEEQLTERFSERFSEQLAAHWAQVRAERRSHAEPVVITGGPSNMARASVPYGVDLAAAWAWRFVVIVAAGYLVSEAIARFSVVVLPVVIALFVTALVVPLVNLLEEALPRGAAALLAVLGVLGFAALMITFATQQVVNGFNDLAEQVVSGLEQIRTWLQEGPLRVTDAQIDNGIQQMQDLVISSNSQVVGRLTTLGNTVGHILAGFFIVLFSTFFFLADGRRIWAWMVRLAPRAAREKVDSSGRVAWLSLTSFVRATVLVALVDAVGIALGAAILQVPFVFAIGILVFIGGFIPLVGATVSGLVAILVALVSQGPIVALIMLGVVIAVQQLEAHILQPFLLGRLVSVHPLAVILVLACGALLAGIAGALVAVPVAAAVNAVVLHLAGHGDPRKDPQYEDHPFSELPPAQTPAAGYDPLPEDTGAPADGGGTRNGTGTATDDGTDGREERARP